MANTTDYERLLEEQKQFYEKKQKENLDTIVMLTEKVKNLEELYEAQQKETDIEHQRYLETAEKYSNKLWEVCQELDIENDDTSQNIIQAIKKLQEENSDKTHRQETMVAYMERGNLWSDFDEWFGENHGISEDDMKHEWVKEWIKNKGFESEEEEDKYDGDDWKWVYGKMIVKNDDGFDDVVLCIAGGGEHWENWIMRPSMNYIENKDGLHPQRGQVLVQSSCGKYVSFQDEDYVCEGDECMCEYEHCVGS